MSLQAQTALLAAVLSLALGVSLVLRRRDKLSVWFAGLTVNLALWWAASFFARLRPDSWAVDLMLPACAPLPVVGLGFYRRLLAIGGDDERSSVPASRVSFLIGPVVLVVAYFAAWDDLFFLDRLCRLLLFASFGLGLYFVWRRTRRTSSRIEATRLMYIFVGGVIAIGLVLSDMITRAGVGDVITPVYLYLVSQAILRQRLLELKEISGKMASLGIEAAFLTAIFGALAIPALITGELGSFALSGIVASVVVLLLIDPARERIEDWVTRRIFQEKALFTAEVAPLLRELGRNIEPAAMAGRLLTSLERTDRVTHAAVYAVDESGGRLTRIGKIGPVGTLSPDDPAVRPVLARLTAGEVLLTDVIETKLRERELRGRGDSAELGPLLMALQGLEIGVAVPFVRDGQLLGFLSVRDERRREAYSREEIELLRQVAAQATLVIENSRLYERVKQRDRLAALGEMSAGLAHEIRNPLGAIKGAAQLVITSPDLPSAQEFLQIIVEEVDRLGAVVGEFLDYARPLRISPQPVDLGQVMKRSVALLGDLARGIEIELDLDDDLPNVPGDPELLTQVFLNLAQNACQAMNGAGRLGLSASLAESGSLVVCRVEDTGPGIPPEVLGNLFVPFFTTKEKGTGLGLAISQRIIERHGGVISARSLPGQGAAFVVRLPTRQSVT